MTMISPTELGSFPPLLVLGFVLAQNLFLQTLPSAPDVAIGLFEYPGPDSDFIQNGADDNDAAIEYPRLQIVSRAAQYDWATARANLDAVRRSLTVRNVSMNGVRYLRIYPLRPLTSSAPDDLQRPVLTTDMQVSKVPS